jgi:2-C-methyl-D-erythritol 4-phosphate cytidylyltransferase/2-C-methyl-D-erythritol 2,4-cyclodiphosphate synthase
MYVSAILAAGGRGHRFGGASPKQLLSIGGRPILERSLSAFLAHRSIDEIIVALPAEVAADPPDYVRRAAKPLRVVAGGERRQDSVARAFREVAEHADVVIVHDAARPFVSADLIDRTIAAAAESGAALAAIQARDTVKLAGPGPGALDGPEGPPGGGHYVRRTLDRGSIFLAQTPQAFRRDVLREALSLDGDATDEAALAERAGHQVRLVEGDPSNIKITTPGDLVIAEAIARGGKPARTGRAGMGYDLHRLVAGRPLVLGGVTIPADRGALGHSDADVVCHAITDAILGAVGLGDIGHHFPESDPRWKGASSLDLLSRAAALIVNEGYEVGNVDVTVILETPRLRPHIDAMRQAIAGCLEVDPSRVSIKAKTNEGVDAVGRGEAIAAHAVALLRAR